MRRVRCGGRRGARLGRARLAGSSGRPRAAAEGEPQVLDVVDGLVDERGDVVVVQLVDDVAAAPLADDEAQVAQDAQLLATGGCDMPIAAASSPTLHAPARRRPRIRTRLGAASACIASATSPAVAASIAAGAARPSTPCPMPQG